MDLTTLDWHRAFSQGAYRRGMDYACDDAVLELQALDSAGLHWRARVRGSRKEPYAVEVQVLPRGARQAPAVLSRCSCPLQSLCKHVAAVLHQAEFDLEEAAEPPRRSVLAAPPAPESLQLWNQWLMRLRQPPPPRAAESEIGLLLRAAPYEDPPALRVAVASFARGKKGGLVNPRNVDSIEGRPSAGPPAGWDPADQVPLQLLLQSQTDRIGSLHYAPLRGAAVEQAFEMLLRRYPAYYERASRVLQPGPALRLQLGWEDLPDARQRLRFAFEDGAPRALLRGNSLWYVDEAALQLGRVEVDPVLFDAVLAAPLLAPAQADALRERLGQGDVIRTIPAPRTRHVTRRVTDAPQGILQLEPFVPTQGAYGSRDTPAEVGVARLRFGYAGIELGLPFVERETRLLEGEVVEIVRDAAHERALMSRLQALGAVVPAQLPWPLSYAFAALEPEQRLLQPKGRRAPLAPLDWHEALHTLAAEGWRLVYTKDFPRPLREVAAGDWDAELSESGNAWFTLALGIQIEGERVDLLPILRRVLADAAFTLQPARGEPPDACLRVPLDEARAVRLPLTRLRTLLAPLLEWLQQEGEPRLHRSQGEILSRLAEVVNWRGDARLRERLVDLRSRAAQVSPPRGFRATLRGYQRAGLAWLEFLGAAGLGGVLADDMGLGKTVQLLAHLLAQRERRPEGFRTLVVAPTSLVGNWRDEAARFTPQLRVLVLHGPERAARYDEIGAHDLVLTTYPLLSRDRERLLQHAFDLLVLDEAQTVKNARSQAAQVVRELRATRRLAMTGTPLENHLGELWAQFDAVEPGLLGSERDFTRLYRTPIEKHGDRERQRRLHGRIGALMLRRRKDEVLKDLPPRTEIVRTLELEGGQRELYEILRLAQHERVREAVAERGLAQSGIVVLDALLKLRQACCDPRLVKLPAARKVTASVKLEALGELLDTLLDEGRRVLLFSQFTSMLDLIEPLLRARGIAFLRLDGDTPAQRRAGLVASFQRGDAPLFLISLKAGGVGLNLTAADTVIHFDPWWNPAVEQQATDRAHRIGQTRPVFVYKLICAGTVEEKILALQTRKAELAQAVLEGGRSTKLRFDEADLAELFAPLR